MGSLKKFSFTDKETHFKQKIFKTFKLNQLNKNFV